MLKYCSRCGAFHDVNYQHPKQHTGEYKDNAQRKFRRSTAWRNKSLEIRHRDRFLCQWCKCQGAYTYAELSVHHIIPIAVDWNKRLDNSNLITLCEHHHRMAEEGEIKARDLEECIKGV